VLLRVSIRYQLMVVNDRMMKRGVTEKYFSKLQKKYYSSIEGGGMYRNKLKFKLFFILFFLPALAFAVDQKGRFAVKGVGAATCKQFLVEKDKNSNNLMIFNGWLNGYLTAINQHSPKTFDIISWYDSSLLITMLGNYCRKNPSHNYYQAGANLVLALGKGRLTENSPLVKTSAGKYTVHVYQHSLMQLQKKLKSLGIYKSTIDGQYGRGTRKAIEKFQKQAKLTVTGVPDQATLLRALQQ